MITTDEIKLFIENDRTSSKKQQAMVGQRYYDAHHDILNRRIYFVNAEGKLEEDKLKSNIRISHPFFTELVDQEVQYLLSGKDGFIKSDIPELQEELDERFNDNEDFRAEMHEVATGAVAKGFEYVYTYKKEDGKTAYQCADSLGVVECDKRYTSDGREYLIYWYVERIDQEGKVIKRIQLWDEQQVYYFCQIDDGDIQLDESEEINPRPHTIYQKKNDKKLYQDGGYGCIPFYRLDNNRWQTSGLQPVKDLIDNYDLINCGLANNIEDTNESLYVVTGFPGDNLDEIMLNIKAKKMIGLDEEGSVDIKTVDIPVEARKAMMEIIEQNIYRFGMGLNTAGLKDTNATTNIAIKAAYSLLDLKTNKLEIRLKQFMRKILKPALDEINKMNKTDYTQSDVYFDFEREVPTNALENAQIELTEAQKRQVEINIIMSLQTVIDDDTRLQLIAEQLDIDYNDLKDKLPEEVPGADVTQAQKALANITADDPAGGEGDLIA